MQNNPSEDTSFLNALEFMISQQQKQLSQSLPNQGNNASGNQNSMAPNPNALMGRQSLQQANLKRSESPFHQNMPMQQPQQTKAFRINNNPMGQDPDALKALFAIPNVPTPPPAFSGQQQAMMQQQQQVAAMRQLMQQQQQQQQKQIPQQMQSMQNNGGDPSIQQALGALLMNANPPNQIGQQFPLAPNNNAEHVMDWRMTMTQQERIQLIMRLGHEVMNIVPPEQRSDARISNLAKNLEKQIYDKSISKPQYILNIHNQINDIQKKAQANPMGVNDPNHMASSRLSAAPPMAHMDSKTVANPANFPAILSLSEEEKAVVQDKIMQILPLHAKLDVLMRTLAQLGGSAEMDKLRRLASIKKVIDTQLEGFPISRYTISPDVANGLHPNLVRFFQYGDALVKQRQQIDDKAKMGPSMMMANSPQIQGNQLDMTMPLGRISNQTLTQGSANNANYSNMGNTKSQSMPPGGPFPPNSQVLQFQQHSLQQAQQQAAQKRQQQFLEKIAAQKQLQQGASAKRESSQPLPSTTELHDLFADPLSPSDLTPVTERTKSNLSSASPSRLSGENIDLFFNIDEATDPALASALLQQNYDYPSSNNSGQTKVVLKPAPASPRKRKAPAFTATAADGTPVPKPPPKRPKKNTKKAGASPTSTASPSSPLTPRLHPLNQELEELKTKFGLDFDIIDVETLIPPPLQFMSVLTGSPLAPSPPSFPSLFINGRVMVLCGLEGTEDKPPVRLAFRLSSRAEYHQSVVVRAHHQHRLRQQQAAEQAASPNARLGSPTTDSLFGEGAIAVDESATVSSSDSQMSSTHPSRAELEIPIWDYRFSTCGLEEVEVLGETSEALSLIRDQLRDLSTKLGVGFMGNTVKITDIVSFLADKV